jgi:polyisoprenoid-binding protein YceI
MFNYKSRFNIRLVAVAIGCLVIATAPARADDGVRYKAKAVGSKVVIDGSSNVHDWTMEGTIIGGYLEVPEGVVLDSSQAAVAGATDGKINARAEVFIPVNSVKSTHYEGMNEAMQAAMKAQDFPRIMFHLTDMKLKQPHAAGTPLEFDTKGELATAGVTNQISLPVRIENMDQSKLKVSGSIPLKMTSFKIDPPRKFGVFITVDDVKITFDWVIGKAVPAKTQ